MRVGGTMAGFIGAVIAAVAEVGAVDEPNTSVGVRDHTTLHIRT